MPQLLVTGALNWDINLFVKHLPRKGEEVVVERIERVPGGKGGNVSVAAARILGPNHVALLACVGRDEVGRKQISILREEGVDTSGVQVLDQFESGQAFITIGEEGSNVIETHFGANAGLEQQHIKQPSVQKLLAKNNLMVVIDPPRFLAREILDEARKAGNHVLWHPGVLTRFGIGEWKDEMKDLDYLVLNAVEAISFTNKRSLDSALSSLKKYVPDTAILVTLGSRGAILHSGDEIVKVRKVQLDRLGKKVVNTTGCGDAFVGTFAAYKTLGVEDAEALRYANLAGALKASRPETRGSPGRRALERAYKRYFA